MYCLVVVYSEGVPARVQAVFCGEDKSTVWIYPLSFLRYHSVREEY
jgi:hypothetical protein